MFPVIKHFDDIKDQIDPEFFYVAVKDGYKVVNYAFNCPDTFKNDIQREFRGLIFDLDGKVLSRRYQKFHNLGEIEQTRLENLDLSKPHVVLEKLDGSMISIFWNGKAWVAGTKLGETDVSAQVEKWLEKNNRYYHLASELYATDNCTMIFEWCSPTQRIVVDYKEPDLVLTGIRNNETGQYMPYKSMVKYARENGISVVKATDGAKLGQELIDFIKVMQGAEGVVIRFDDGFMLKIKADHYCLLHKVKEQINNEKGVVELLLTEKVDDLKPLLLREDLEKLEAYEKAFFQEVVLQSNIDIVEYTLDLREAGISRKDYALNIAPKHPKYFVSAIFKMWDVPQEELEQAAKKWLKDYILSHCSQNKKFEELKQTGMFKEVPQWKPVMFDTEA